MKIATWNVNSLKVRLPQLLDWLDKEQADVVCLQETKLEDHNFPQAELAAAGYQVAFFGQKTYNGVAILSRTPLSEVTAVNPHFADDPQKRLIAASINGVRIVCAYIPNGEALESEKYAYKMRWLEALQLWLAEQMALYPQLVFAGDFNIAPEDRDVHHPEQWAGKILCSPPERAHFQQFIDLGLCDSFRLFTQAEQSYSWWDYRMLGFQRNLGARIDHILLSAPLAARCANASIERAMRKLERPSDHAPVMVNLNDAA